jgi:hypothetical protein
VKKIAGANASPKWEAMRSRRDPEPPARPEYYRAFQRILFF